MFVEAATAVTAVATAATAMYAYLQYRQDVNRWAPPIRVHGVTKHGDLIMVSLSIYPTDHQLFIQRISVPGHLVALALHEQHEKTGSMYWSPAHEHSDFVDVEFDLLPSSLSSKEQGVILSLRLRKPQNSVLILFHRSKSRFSARHKIKATISRDTE